MPAGQCPECWPTTFDPLYPVRYVGAVAWCGTIVATAWVFGVLLGNGCRKGLT